MNPGANIQVFLAAFQEQVKVQGLVFWWKEAGLEELIRADMHPAERTRIILDLGPDHFRGGPFCGPAQLAYWHFETGLGAAVWEILLAKGHPTGPAICLGFRQPLGHSTLQAGKKVSPITAHAL